MNPPATVRVTDPEGVHGTIDTAAWPLDGRRAVVLVSLESGPQVWVPVHLLTQEEEGRYAVPMALADLERAGAGSGEPPLVLPVLAETLEVQRRRVETGRDWTALEPEARRDWEARHQGTWDEFKDTIRHAWEKVRGRR